jgi:hypothetical protein
MSILLPSLSYKNHCNAMLVGAQRRRSRCLPSHMRYVFRSRGEVHLAALDYLYCTRRKGFRETLCR